MKRLLIFIAVLIGIILGTTLIAHAATSVFQVFQGGTGTSSPSGILYGDNSGSNPLKTVSIGAGCTFITGTLSCPGTGLAASSTLLGDNNTFSGSNTFTQTLNLIPALNEGLYLQDMSLGASVASTSGIWLQNTTPAAAGAQQNSPAITLEGQDWGTTAPASSTPVEFTEFVLPLQGTTVASGSLVWERSLSSGPFVTDMTLTAAGTLEPLNLEVAGGAIGSTNTTNGNIWVPGAALVSHQALAQYSIGTSSSNAIGIRTGFYGLTSTVLTAGDNYAGIVVGNAPVTTAVSGLHNWLTNVAIKALGSVTLGVAKVGNTASLYIDGAATTTVNGLDYDLYASSTGPDYFGGNVGINTPTPNFNLEVQGTASTTNLDIGGLSGIAAGSFLAINPSGQVIATTTPSRGAASSTLLVDNNTFAGLNAFTNAGTTTFAGGLQMTEINETGASTSTFNNGIQISSGCFAVGSTCIGSTSASSTLLSDNNTFSGSNIFSQPLSLTSVTGTTTISGNQGFTVGGFQFAVQGSTGQIGINKTPSLALLDIGGNYTTANAQQILLTGTLLSSLTGTQAGANFSPNFTPSGASLSNMEGVSSSPGLTAASSIDPAQLIGFVAQIRNASTTSTINGGFDFDAVGPSNAGTSVITNYRAYQAGGAINGDGNTSGSITNIGFYGLNSTASSSVGGIISNFTSELTVPTGSPNGGTTNNRGLYITGNGGTNVNGGVVHNYALYNDSTANNYFAGNVGVASTTPWGQVSITNAGSNPAFYIANSNNTTAQFIVASNGNTGIGTTTPSAPLTVQNGSGIIATFASTGATGYSQIALQGTGHQYQIGVGNASESAFGVANKYFIFDANAAAMRMVIDSSGNLGVGTTTPGSILSVNNVANFTAATSTFYGTGGFNIAAGCYAIAGSCIGTGGSSASSTLLSDSNTFSGNNIFSQITKFSNGFLSQASSTVTGNLTLATTTTGSLNGTIVVSGFPYPQTGAGIQQALNIGCPNGSVFLPAATYSITQKIIIPSNCTLEGSGWNSILSFANSTAELYTLASYNVTIKDLQIDQSAVTSGSLNSIFAIYDQDVDDFNVNDVRIKNAYSFGIFSNTTAITGSSTRLTFTNNYINGMGNSDPIGGGPSDSTSTMTDVVVQNNRVYQNAGIGAFYTNAIDLVRSNQFIYANNDTHGGILLGSEQTPDQNSRITGNLINAADGTTTCAFVSVFPGSSATTSSTNITINNNILTNAYLGIVSNTLANGIGQFSVSGNSINGTGCPYSILVQNANGGTVSDNSTASSTVGISIASSQHISVTGNSDHGHSSSGIASNGTSANNTYGLNNLYGNGTDYSLVETTNTANIQGALTVTGSVTGTDIFAGSGNVFKDFSETYLDAGSGHGIHLRPNNGSEAATILSGGNFGIGSTTPNSLLSVGNTNGINFSTATSTFYSTGGVNLSSGCFAIAGNCLSVSSLGGTAPIANGGTNQTSQTTNGVNYFDGTHITSNSSFTWDGSRLTVPGQLYVNGGTLFISQGQQIQNASNGAQEIGFPSAGDFTFGGVNVGISTTTPGSLLSLGVSGNASGINFSLATSTFENAGGINLTTGCFAINGTCIGGSGGSGTVTSVTAASPNSTLSLGGTNPVTTSGIINFDLNLTHPNFWTGLQNFTNASSSEFTATSTVWHLGATFFGSSQQSNISASGVLTLGTPLATGSGGTGSSNLGTGVVQASSGVLSAANPTRAFIMGVASTTALTGTTTAPQFSIPIGLTVTSWSCTVAPAGATAEVEWQYANPTAYTNVTPTYLAASTTPGNVSISTNNTPTAQATSTLSVGNVTGNPTSVNCSFLGNSTTI